MFALAIFASALVAVVQLFALATFTNQRARASTIATVLAAQKMEQLRALRWAFDSQNSPVSDLRTNLAVTPPAADGGPGLAPSPAGALDTSTDFHVDYLDADGAWVGTGTSPVPGTVYVRRWSITPLPEDPANTLVLQVLVTRLRQASATSAPRRLPGDARLVSLKTRRF